MLMAIIIGADAGSSWKMWSRIFSLEKTLKQMTKEGQDFCWCGPLQWLRWINKRKILGIVIDAYGAGPFTAVATKIKGMVAAEVSDERSAYMTRGHNNSRMITMGAEIVGEGLLRNRQRLCQW